jgi:hypothetical protein
MEKSLKINDLVIMKHSRLLAKINSKYKSGYLINYFSETIGKFETNCFGAFKRKDIIKLGPLFKILYAEKIN